MYNGFPHGSERSSRDIVLLQIFRGLPPIRPLSPLHSARDRFDAMENSDEVWEDCSDDSGENKNSWKWPPTSVKLYFFDDEAQRRLANHVKAWQELGAETVLDKNDCTHLVMDYKHTGHADRDQCADRDLDWAERNGVGNTPTFVAYTRTRTRAERQTDRQTARHARTHARMHICVALCLHRTLTCVMRVICVFSDCVSTFWLRTCLHRHMLLDPRSSEGAALLRPLPSSKGIPEMRHLHVCEAPARCRETATSFEDNSSQNLYFQTLWALHLAGVKCHAEYVSECSLIAASEECQPELVGEGRGGKRYRWADGQEWTVSHGIVDHRVRAREIVCLMCVCTLPNQLHP